MFSQLFLAEQGLQVNEADRLQAAWVGTPRLGVCAGEHVLLQTHLAAEVLAQKPVAIVHKSLADLARDWL